MKDVKYAVPEYVTADDIKRVRKLLGLTQKDFAALIGCSRPTVERWEGGDGKATGPLVLLLRMLEDHPEYVQKIAIPEQQYPVRLWYMHRQKICTVIDVDEIQRKVQIRNYTNHAMFCAFGVNEQPTYQDYQAFLESRCFPESRDKMKLVLKDLGLPFYDPFLIIEKTEGRMAEDDFWIRIERKKHD